MESLTRPFFHHRRRLSNASSSNGLSFSSKDAYDDVLVTASKMKPGTASSFASRAVAVEDYGDIFGGRTAKNGSSIPVLDLSDLDRANGSVDLRSSNSKLDYSKIFGGFAGDDITSAVPPYEELFAGVKKAKCDKPKARTPAVIGSSLKGSDDLNSSENSGGFSSEASGELFGGGKQLNMSYHKTSQHNKDGSNGTTHIAQLHVVPGFTCFIDGSAQPQKTPQDKPIPPVKMEVRRNRSFSGDITEGRSGRRAKWQLPNTQSSEVLVHGKDDCSQDQSHLNDKLFNSGELNFKSYPSKVSPPSSSSANLNDSKGHSKLSKSSAFCPKSETLEKDASGYLTPSSDEDLDVNSAAAAPAAALRKAIQQAQESIRIAKELMERQKGPIQNSKSRSRPSLKVKDIRETRNEQDMSHVGENNIKGACESINTEVPDFAAFDQKIARESDQKIAGEGVRVASAFKPREEPSIERKAEAEKHEKSDNVAEEQGVATWFTQLLNNGKNRMAALASQLVDSKNNTFQSGSKHTHHVEEAKPAEQTLGKGTIEQMETVSGVPELVDTGAKLNAFGRVAALDNSVGKSNSTQSVHEGKINVTLLTDPEDEATKKIPNDFYEEDNRGKKLEDCQVKMDDRQFECEKLESGCLDNEFVNLVERKKEEKISFQIKAEKKVDDFGAWEDNEITLVEDETEKKQEEACLWKGNEDKPKAAILNDSDGKRQEDFPVENIPENGAGGYHLRDGDEQRSTNSLDEVLSQNMSDEEFVHAGIDQGPGWTCQNEVADCIDADADVQNEKISVNHEGQEIDDVKGEPDESEENPGADLFPDSAYEEDLSAYLDACINADSTNISETPEVCRSEAENISEQISQLVIRNVGENDNLAGMMEQTSQVENRNDGKSGHIDLEEDDDEVEQEEEADRLKESKLFETSLKDETIAEENILESRIQDVSEGPAYHDQNEKFVFNPAMDDEKFSTGSDSETTTSIYSSTKDYAIENNDGIAAPPHVEVSSSFGFTEMNRGKQTEDSDEVSEFASGPENADGSVHESQENTENVMEDCVAFEKEVRKDDIELDSMESDRGENQKEQDYSQLPSSGSQWSEEHSESDTEMNTGQSMEKYEANLCNMFAKEEKETGETEEEKETGETEQKEVGAKDYPENLQVNNREREREKDRIAVERAIREARERAFAEARERAERAAVEKATAEVRQRAMAEAREKLDKGSSRTKVSADKVSIEAKLRAERAAVERATAEARERALEKALSQKTTSEARGQAEKIAGRSSGVSRHAGIKHSFSSSDLDRFDGTNNESAQRRKARLERHQRIMERAAKALAEKNMRDILAQREQAERNRLAETLDADVKRWASGKEGNLRALLSTLQYILGTNSGWQPISLTEIITTSAVRKAYRKATLYVHPDKLQQRGASIQQKYICEKVFDLLKAAWNKFNSEER